MQNMKPTLQAYLLILLSALLWGGEYVVVKDMVEYLPSNWINAFRFIAASPDDRNPVYNGSQVRVSNLDICRINSVCLLATAKKNPRCQSADQCCYLHYENCVYLPGW